MGQVTARFVVGLTSRHGRRNAGAITTAISPMPPTRAGFDYLRDNMAADISEVVRREFQYCVIDEVDSI